MVEGMPNCKLNFNLCEHCLYGKKIGVKIPFGATREKGILELIHNGVSNLVPVLSLGDLYIMFP